MKAFVLSQNIFNKHRVQKKRKDPMADGLKTNIQYIKGVGEKKALAFSKLGIFTIGDLLENYPRTYEDWNNLYRADNAPEDRACAIKAVITGRSGPARTRTGKLITKFTAFDGMSRINLIFYNNPYVSKNIFTGKEYIFFGKINDGEMISPAYDEVQKAHFIHPVYPSNSSINSKMIAKTVKAALTEFSPYIEESLPEEQIKKYKLMGKADAIKAIHFPRNDDDIKNARRRLIYEELLILQLGIMSAGNDGREKTAPVMKKDFTGEFLASLPFSPTSAQVRAVRECTADMCMKTPMRRLLQGDVGSGKTAVAAALIFNAIKNGHQCVLMAPTEILAGQHKKTFDSFFEGMGINTVLLTGSTTAKNKKLIKQDIADGTAQLIIGTHAVITDDTKFKDLALAVTDEQHRFGVNQRAALREKGKNPHVLVMSATPIPRTLSLIIYGDLDISILDEKPKGRQDIDTFRVTSAYHERLYKFIRKQVSEGHQCYIVCPLVEENEENFSGRISAEEYAAELSSKVFSDLNTAVLHGKMKQKQKDEIMKSFSAGDIDILICTVVIEVGIDVPNATLMVIENAECFGLSQLHQLRGRVGRGGTKSYCVLVSDSKSQTSKERFNIMCSTNDGFALAEADLKMRGPGDFFGSRQSGLPELKIASLMTDSKILYAARNEAAEILRKDPELSAPENTLLREKISGLFADIS